MYYYSNGSECPLPRRVKVTIANAIATPIADPYTAIDASAIGYYYMIKLFINIKGNWKLTHIRGQAMWCFPIVSCHFAGSFGESLDEIVSFQKYLSKNRI